MRLTVYNLIIFYLQGLKFMSFPYLLTLQLKRFAFDYATLHRVKLNDRLVFDVKNRLYPCVKFADIFHFFDFFFFFFWLTF